MAVLCGQRRTRVLGWPRDWRPREVYRNGEPLTDEGAWELIRELLLDERVEVSEMKLDDPPGKTGYVMLVKLEGADPEVYIKLELGSGAIIARSFHYTHFPKKV